MYELNQILVYGSNGVCKLVDIRKEKFTGSPAMYYILAPIFCGQSTLYVPIENEKLASKLRPVMLKEKLHEMVLAAKSSEPSWEKDDRVRGEDFQRIVSNGMSCELLTLLKSLLLKSLMIHKNELKQTVRKLHNADERVLAQCEKIIGEEFAYAFGVEVDDALSHIKSELVA